jgi:2-polyprenyl-3-methyl-5-hydroxy-6-metoxy-1,4-benzoquinol methylase
MDQPGLEPNRHRAALRGLARINWWSGSAHILWPPIWALAQARGGEPLRILDVATGGGDVPIRLWQRARRHGLALQIDGCDVSAAAVAHARREAEQQAAAVQFLQRDVCAGALPTGYDVLVSSLFLHHLDEEEAVELLRRMAAAARRLVLVNDLARSRTGFVLAYLGTRLLSRSAIVHTDGPLSVEGAFTLAEASDLARQAGLHGARVERRWPCRFLLSWSRP